MPQTAITPFREDIARAKALVAHARTLPEATDAQKLLRDDIRRSSWMFAVGAMDAYFCDAYSDLIAATLMAKSNQPAVPLPEFIGKIEIPVTAVLEDYRVRQNWKWRMAARRMMAEQNALELETVRNWFNPFCADGSKIFAQVLPTWITRPGATARLFGIAPRQFGTTTGRGRDQAIKTVNKTFKERFDAIVQRRHDCIHTCDRPANTPQPISREGTVTNVIKDIEFIVENSNTHIDAAFRAWLRACGFSPVTLNQVGY
jgi:hypothetical protein